MAEQMLLNNVGHASIMVTLLCVIPQFSPKSAVAGIKSDLQGI
jgi:hypothetical protein